MYSFQFTDVELSSLSRCVASRLASLDIVFRRCFNEDNVYAIENILPCILDLSALYEKLTDTQFIFESRELSDRVYGHVPKLEVV